MPRAFSLVVAMSLAVLGAPSGAVEVPADFKLPIDFSMKTMTREQARALIQENDECHSKCNWKGLLDGAKILYKYDDWKDLEKEFPIVFFAKIVKASAEWTVCHQKCGSIPTDIQDRAAPPTKVVILIAPGVRESLGDKLTAKAKRDALKQVGAQVGEAMTEEKRQEQVRAAALPKARREANLPPAPPVSKNTHVDPSGMPGGTALPPPAPPASGSADGNRPPNIAPVPTPTPPPPPPKPREEKKKEQTSPTPDMRKT